MTVHHARVIALAVVLVGISALVPSTRVHAQQQADEAADVIRVLTADAETQYQRGAGNGRCVAYIPYL